MLNFVACWQNEVRQLKYCSYKYFIDCILGLTWFNTDFQLKPKGWFVCMRQSTDKSHRGQWFQNHENIQHWPLQLFTEAKWCLFWLFMAAPIHQTQILYCKVVLNTFPQIRSDRFGIFGNFGISTIVETKFVHTAETLHILKSLLSISELWKTSSTICQCSRNISTFFCVVASGNSNEMLHYN